MGEIYRNNGFLRRHGVSGPGLYTAVVFAVVSLVCLLFSRPVTARPGARLDYAGYSVYPQFTRVVFNTPRTKPESYNIRYDEMKGRVVVFVSGGVDYTFKPVRGMEGTVKDVDYIQLPDSSIGVVLRLASDAIGFRVSYLHGPDRLVIDVYREPKTPPFMSISRRVNTIVIDPGHGGDRPGAHAGGSLVEKDVMSDLAQRLADRLRRMGYQTVLTRTGDAGTGVIEREGLANNAMGDLYVSLHASAGFGVRAFRRGVYVIGVGPLDGRGPQSEPLGWTGQQAAYLPDALRLAKELAGGLSALGGGSVRVKDLPVYGLDGLAMPAALVEVGTMSELSDDGFRDKSADALSRGINAYASGVRR